MPPKKYAPPRAATDVAAATQPKQRAPPSKPSDMSNADWKAEVQRWDAVTIDRRNRANAKRAPDMVASAALAMVEHVDQTETSRAGMMNLPGGQGPYVSWSQQSVGSSAGFPPSPQPWGCTPSSG